MYFATSFCTVFFILYFLNKDFIVPIFIVLGQAHFLIAYLYTHRGGKMSTRYVAKLSLLFLFFGCISSFLFLKKDIFLSNLLILITLIIFVFHYFVDEYKIAGLQDFSIRIWGLHSILLSFLAFFLVSLFNLTSKNYFIIFLSLISLVYGIFFSFLLLKNNREENNKKKLFLLFYCLNIFGIFYVTFIKQIHINYVAGCIILFHYVRWYVRYFVFFKGKILREYIYIIIGCNVFFLFLFGLHITYSGSLFLTTLFNPIFFYGWTMMHIIMSTRKEDLKI